MYMYVTIATLHVPSELDLEYRKGEGMYRKEESIHTFLL